MLLQAFYGIRSERQLMERLEFDLLFRWFVGLGVDDPVWDHSTFSKNRDRLLEGEIAAKFLAAVLAQPKVKRLLSSDHFSVDGTLIEAWASIKSFRRKDGGDDDQAGAGPQRERSFHKEKRSNETHQSTTDPDARLYKKARRAAGQALLPGACPDGEPPRPGGRRRHQSGDRHGRAGGGVGADRWPGSPETADHARGGQGLRRHAVCARSEGSIGHPAHRHRRTLSKTGIPRKTAVDGRTTRHAGYDISQRCRKRIEEVFGWIKSSAGLAKVKLRGRDRVDAAFTLALAAYNLIRLPKLLARRMSIRGQVAHRRDARLRHGLVEPPTSVRQGRWPVHLGLPYRCHLWPLRRQCR